MPHILLVDDEEAVRYVFERYLGILGYRVTTACDGVEALHLHRADPADLVITDFRMPRMDGGALLAQLRRESPQLPAILISANPVDAGPLLADVRFFAKPVSMPLLAETVAAMVGRAPAAAPGRQAESGGEMEAPRSEQCAAE